MDLVHTLARCGLHSLNCLDCTVGVALSEDPNSVIDNGWSQFKMLRLLAEGIVHMASVAV